MGRKLCLGQEYLIFVKIQTWLLNKRATDSEKCERHKQLRKPLCRRSQKDFPDAFKQWFLPGKENQRSQGNTGAFYKEKIRSFWNKMDKAKTGPLIFEAV